MARVSRLFILVLFVFGVDSYDDPTERLVDDEINKLGTGKDKDELSPMRRVVDTFVSVAVSGVTSTDEIFKNASVFGDNLLWRNLITECGPSTSLSCVKRNVFNYLDRTVSTVGDVAVTDSLVFERNYHAFENKYDRSKNEPPAQDDAAASEGRSINTFEDVADALVDKGERFLQSHDLRLQLPSMLLGGAVLRLSPRALAEGGGALLTVEPAPTDVAEARSAGEGADEAEGRIFFKHAKKVFRRRLLLSLFALLLVVKLLKVAVMFLLPVLLGVGTAKKIVLKVLLFLFPALAHLFKFCSYYHGLHAATKYHHHHHQIAHHHHHVPVHVPVPVHVHHDHHDHLDHHGHHGHHLDDGPTIYASAPGPSYHDAGPPVHGGPWGPPPPHDYTARTELLAAAQHNENELATWGLGGGPGGVARDTFGIADNAVQGQRSPQAHRLAYSAYSYLDDPRVSRSAQPVTEPTKVFPVASKASHAAPAAPAPAAQQFLQYVQPQSKKDIKVATAGATVAVGQSTDQATLLRAQQQMLMRQQQLKMLQQQQLQQQLQQHQLQQQQLQQQLQLKQQQALRIQVVTPKPVPATTVQVAYDAFYSPILQRMDNVFVGLGFNEEACRERLVCSMYKNPPKFSPHSNHISNELSRDEAELRKPAVQNSAVARFQRYVQAARDGQEQRDCLRLYPACTVNTEL